MEMLHLMNQVVRLVFITQVSLFIKLQRHVVSAPYILSVGYDIISYIMLVQYPYQFFEYVWVVLFQPFREIDCVTSIVRYQGRYGREILEYVLGIDDAHFRSGFMAMDGDVNLMKAAIVASTAVTTVSPTYAEEIQTEYYGYRLDSVLRMNSYKLHGILNGIDMDAFNPQTDTKIFKQYGPDTPDDKLVNKRELLKLCGLEGDDNTPVIGIVTRFVDQKGLDLVEAVLPDILEDDVRLIVLGTGDWKYEQMFIEAKRRWPEKVSASIMFSGDLANRIYAGADMFLMLTSMFLAPRPT